MKSGVYIGVGLLSLVNAFAVGAEECQFQFATAEGTPRVTVTVKPDDGFRCSQLESLQEFFDGIEFLYFNTFDVSSSGQFAKPPNFKLTKVEHDLPFPNLITDENHMINVLHNLGQGFWDRGQAIADGVAMQPASVPFEIKKGKNEVDKKVFTTYRGDWGVQLKILMPDQNRVEWTIHVLFKSGASLQEVFDALSRGREIVPAEVILEERRAYGVSYVKSQMKWADIARFIANSAPIKKFETSDTLEINASKPNILGDDELQHLIRFAEIPPRLAKDLLRHRQISKSVDRKAMTKPQKSVRSSSRSPSRRRSRSNARQGQRPKQQDSLPRSESEESSLSCSEAEENSQSSEAEENSQSSEADENSQLWFNSFDFHINESELKRFTANDCDNIGTMTSYRVDILLPVEGTATETDPAIFAIFPKKVELQPLLNGLSRGKCMSPLHLFVRIGGKFLRFDRWADILKRIKTSPPPKDETKNWTQILVRSTSSLDDEGQRIDVKLHAQCKEQSIATV